MNDSRKEPGRIVEVNGKRGRTKNSDRPVNGKILVYYFGEDNRQSLVSPENIKYIGFID